MSINLVTYANQTVTPTNDAIIYEKAVDQNGIFYGCNVTVSGNNVNITGGYGIVCGREFVIESESIPVTLAPSVPLDGRLYVRLDLADADNPIQLLTAQGGTLPALEQDANVNYVNGVWEMELATFTVGVSALSDVVETFETIVGVNEKILKYVEVRTTIWTNPNPSSAFASQTISMDLSGYDAIEIVFANSSSANQGGVIVKMIPASGASLTVLTNSTTNTTTVRQRACSATSAGVAFTDARNGSNGDNGVVIPLRIYGIIGGGY